MVRNLALSIVLTTLAGVASAGGRGPITCTTHYFFGFPYEVCKAGPTPSPVAAPEIDAASAVAGLTLMIGGLAVLRGRRTKLVATKA